MPNAFGQGGFSPNGNGQQWSDGNVPSLGGSGGEAAQQDGGELILLGVSAAVLAAGLIVAIKFKR